MSRLAPRALLLAAGLALVLAGPIAGQSLEYQVKAVCLVNFAKFVEWPPARLPAGEGALVIGVVGSREMLEALKRVSGVEPVRGRPLEVRERASCAGFEGHILYLGEGTRAEDAAAVAGRAGLLVVGEARAPMPGVIIGFFLQDNTVKFEASMKRARLASLRLSSRLLKVARVVEEEGEP